VAAWRAGFSNEESGIFALALRGVNESAQHQRN
jgi:hypothetical protein